MGELIGLVRESERKDGGGNRQTEERSVFFFFFFFEIVKGREREAESEKGRQRVRKGGRE